MLRHSARRHRSDCGATPRVARGGKRHRQRPGCRIASDRLGAERIEEDGQKNCLRQAVACGPERRKRRDAEHVGVSLGTAAALGAAGSCVAAGPAACPPPRPRRWTPCPIGPDGQSASPGGLSSDRGIPARLKQDHAPTRLDRPLITNLHEQARRVLSAANEDVRRTPHMPRWQAWTR